jgi:hypothetical protein
MTEMPLTSVWEKQSFTNINFFRDCKLSGLYELNPEHQRNVVHDEQWMVGVLHSSFYFKDIPTVYFYKKPYSNGTFVNVSLDGKQRCSAIIGYMSDKFRYTETFPPEMTNKLYSELDTISKHKFDNNLVDAKIYQGDMTNIQISNFFQRHQVTKLTNLGEMLNSCLTSELRHTLNHILQNDTTLLYYLARLKKKTQRFEHLDILARMAFVFRNPEAVNDPSNEEIYTWWKTESFDKEDSKDFASAATKVCKILSRSDIKYASSRGIYMSFMKFIVLHPYEVNILCDVLDQVEIKMPNTIGIHNCSHLKYEYLLELVNEFNPESFA